MDLRKKETTERQGEEERPGDGGMRDKEEEETKMQTKEVKRPEKY